MPAEILRLEQVLDDLEKWALEHVTDQRALVRKARQEASRFIADDPDEYGVASATVVYPGRP